jgi:hypothetical protein
MIVRVHSVEEAGLSFRGLVRPRLRASVTFGEIVTAERIASRRGFQLHGPSWQRLVVVIRRSGQRRFEQQLRAHGVVIVDEWGARIDDSQFEKEADPRFNWNVDDGPPFLVAAFAPMFVVRWWDRVTMRQSSDDAAGE